MDVAAFVVALIALAVSAASVVYTRRAAHAAESEAASAAAAEHRANSPRLVVEIEETVDYKADKAIYKVRNDGPTDLDRLTVRRPRTDDGVRYPLARVGEDWCEDEAELGPISMGQTARFVLSIGTAERTPEFRVRFVAVRGANEWEQVVLLDHPKHGPFLIV